VYSALRVDNNQPIAVKVMDMAGRSEKERAHIGEEISAMSKLKAAY